MKNLKLIHEHELYISIFDPIVRLMNWGLYLTVFSTATKVCFGVVTFCMILSLYLKVRIIYEK